MEIVLFLHEIFLFILFFMIEKFHIFETQSKRSFIYAKSGNLKKSTRF